MRPAGLTLCGDDAAFAAAVAEVVETTIGAALAARTAASLALPGGGTPRRYLPAVARLALDWRRVVLTLTDERWVAQDDSNSNEALVRSCLLLGPAAQARLIGLKTVDDDPAQALPAIETALAAVPWPLDLVLLGVGDDGHIASLFPGATLAAQARIVAASAPAAPHARVSLSLPALVAARRIVMVAAGARKLTLIERALQGLGGTLPVDWLCAQAGSRVSAVVLL